MQRWRLLAISLSLVGLVNAGCAYRYIFRTGQEPSKTQIVKEWKNIGFWGWIEPSPFDLSAACPGGVAEFGSYVSAPNWFCALVTAGLYSPRTAYAIPIRGRETNPATNDDQRSSPLVADDDPPPPSPDPVERQTLEETDSALDAIKKSFNEKY